MSSKVYERTQGGTTTRVSIRKAMDEVNHAMMGGKHDVREMSSGRGRHSIDYKDGRSVLLVEVEGTVDDNDRDWGVIAVTTTLLGTSGGRAVSEEIAAQADHLVVVSRERGGEWQPTADPQRPSRYTYLVDGELTAGTLVDYAQAWKTELPETGHVSPDVRTWEGARFDVTVERRGVIRGWMYYRLSVGAEWVDVSFDGRD